MNENAKLSEEKLLECFKSFNIPVRMADIKTPSKDFIIRVFAEFLKDLQINIASHLLRPFESVKHLENPEIYEEARMLIILAKVMTQLISHISPISITINDIVAPKPKRTKKILNFLVILWNNYLRKIDLVRKVEHSLQEEVQKFEDIRIENNDLKVKYQECMTKLQNMQFSSDKLAAKEEKEKHLEKCREEFLELYNSLKEKETNTMTEIANTDILIVTLKEKLDELDQLIISSPEKINADIRKLIDKEKEIEDKIQEKELERMGKKRNIELLEKAQESLIKHMAKQQKIVTELQVFSENAQKMCSLKNKLVEERKILNELESSHELMELMASNYDQKASKIQFNKQKQIEEITETFEMLQKQLSEEKDQQKKLDLSISLLKKKTNNEVLAVQEVFKELKNAVSSVDEIKNAYEAQKLRIEENFQSDCKSVVEKIKKVYGPL